MNPDIVIDMEFDMKADKVQIKTNAKHERVADLLEDYLHAQVGTCKDIMTPEDHDIYKIVIGVELGHDAWGSSHNCGNRGLRDGILLRVLQMVSHEPDRVTFVD